MSTPTQEESNATALAAQAALSTAANNVFIAEATSAIADAVSQGKQIIFIYSIPEMNFQEVFAYFQNLGYVIGIPSSLAYQAGPAELFGEFWDYYWMNILPHSPAREPVQILITWRVTFP